MESVIAPVSELRDPTVLEHFEPAYNQEVAERSRFKGAHRLGALSLATAAMLMPTTISEAHAEVPTATIQPSDEIQPICTEFDSTGHRGTTAGYDENTISAYNSAYVNNAKTIEIDVRFSKDGVPVIMHDATLGRMTNGSGYVSERTWGYISRLRTPRGQRVPTLRQVANYLAHRPDVNLQAEVKPAASTRRLARMDRILRETGVAARTTVTSFNTNVLSRYHTQVNRRIKKGVLSHDHVDHLAWMKKYRNVQTVLYPGHIASEAEIADAHRHGVRVGVWTINRIERIAEFARRGADSVATDRIADLRSYCGFPRR